MKKVIAVIALAALAGNAHAQLNPLPPSSTTDGISVLTEGINAGATHWDATPGLASYKFASDDNLGTPKPGTPDNALGLNWASTSPQVANLLSQVNTKGGIIRAIFLGESAGWLNDFGYTYNGMPQSSSSYTVFSNIQAKSGTPYPVSIAYGNYIDVSLGIGQAASFDFWLNGVGENGLVNPVPPTTYGGVYTAFNPANSNPYNAPGNVKITTSSLAVSTWVAVDSAYEDISTYLVGFEDWRTDRGADGDANDFMFAVQFLDVNGRIITPVPEPSTYGLIGAVALLGLVVARRFKVKK